MKYILSLWCLPYSSTLFFILYTHMMNEGKLIQGGKLAKMLEGKKKASN